MPDSGQIGISVESRQFSAAIEGQFGISVQLGSNALIKVVDQFGLPMPGITLVITYMGTTSTINYDYRSPVNRTFPEDTDIFLEASGGSNITAASGTYRVPLGGQATFTLVVSRKQTSRLIRRRY